MSTSAPRALVVVRAGDGSLHRGWIAGASRGFDLFVSYYGAQPGRWRDDGDGYEMRVGSKYPALADLLEAHPEWLDRYDVFWFPDDDLEASTATLDRMFALVRAFDLQLAQPALTHDSPCSFRILRQRADYVLRHTRFVEVMAPLFKRAALRRCLPTFRESRSGWGLDFVWPSLLADAGPRAIGVLDATPVRHTRPVGGGDMYRNHPEMDPRREMQALLARYGLLEAPVDAKYVFHGGVARVAGGRWERARSRLRAWAALRRLRRRRRAGR